MRLPILIVCALALSLTPSPSPAQAGKELIEKIESPYNTILVYRRAPYVTLAFGYKNKNYVESRRNPDDLLELSVDYTRAMLASLVYAADRQKFLMIGMGGGSISWYVHEQLPNSHVTAIELDPEIIRLAEKYYRLKAGDRLRIVESDGRIFLVRDKDSYDVIFVDAYRGPFVPFHLLTKEFFELIKKRLKPGGVIAQNIEPSTMLF
ncbi:MAG: fused MFS/spermidine synthase, partial [Pseudomonadota bacterium]|nr:fused MFS/spermidine synthase [Pseudomonadota bacterium]